jgi:hypothetical protein
MLSAEFYGHATGTLAFGVRQGSVHAQKLNTIGCSEQSVLLFIVANPAYSWPKSVLTVVLQLKVFCPEPTTCMRLCLPKFRPISFRLTFVVDKLQGLSTIRRQVSLQGVEQLALPCRPCLWLPLLCDVLSSAHVTLLPLAMAALDLRSLSMLFWAVLPPHRTMFWPPCSAVFSVLSCVQAMYQQHGR